MKINQKKNGSKDLQLSAEYLALEKVIVNENAAVPAHFIITEKFVRNSDGSLRYPRQGEVFEPTIRMMLISDKSLNEEKRLQYTTVRAAILNDEISEMSCAGAVKLTKNEFTIACVFNTNFTPEKISTPYENGKTGSKCDERSTDFPGLCKNVRNDFKIPASIKSRIVDRLNHYRERDYENFVTLEEKKQKVALMKSKKPKDARKSKKHSK